VRCFLNISASGRRSRPANAGVRCSLTSELRGRRRRPANAGPGSSTVHHGAAQRTMFVAGSAHSWTELRRNAQPAKRGARANNANIATDAAPRNGSKGPTNAQLSARGDDYPKHFHQAHPDFADNSGRDGNGAQSIRWGSFLPRGVSGSTTTHSARTCTRANDKIGLRLSANFACVPAARSAKVST